MKSSVIVVIALLALVVIVGGYIYLSPPAANNQYSNNGGNLGGSNSNSNALNNSSPQTLSITINGFAFSPKSLEISAGSTVTWTNMDSFAHTVTSDSGTELASGQLAAGSGTYSHTFSTPGTYTYHCSNHPTMTGTIIVK